MAAMGIGRGLPPSCLANSPSANFQFMERRETHLDPDKGHQLRYSGAHWKEKVPAVELQGSSFARAEFLSAVTWESFILMDCYC